MTRRTSDQHQKSWQPHVAMLRPPMSVPRIYSHHVTVTVGQRLGQEAPVPGGQGDAPANRGFFLKTRSPQPLNRLKDYHPLHTESARRKSHLRSRTVRKVRSCSNSASNNEKTTLRPWVNNGDRPFLQCQNLGSKGCFCRSRDLAAE